MSRLNPPVHAELAFKVMTVNTHKGFTFFNRKFILHELRDAVRAVGADVVFLQEVQGTHAKHAAARQPPGPTRRTTSSWPTRSGREFAYGRNAVYPHGHHGNAVLSKFPIPRYENHDVSIGGPEQRAACCTACCACRGARSQMHAICVHLGLQESHRQQAARAAVPPGRHARCRPTRRC